MDEDAIVIPATTVDELMDYVAEKLTPPADAERPAIQHVAGDDHNRFTLCGVKIDWQWPALPGTPYCQRCQELDA